MKELEEILKEKENRQKENGCRIYVPSQKTEEFIRAVGSMKYISLFIAANGTGKSCVGANIIANIVYGKQPFEKKRSRWEDRWGVAPDSFYDYTLFRDYPYKNKRIRIISDPTGIKEKIVPELKKWFLSNRYELNYSTLKFDIIQVNDLYLFLGHWNDGEV